MPVAIALRLFVLAFIVVVEGTRAGFALRGGSVERGEGCPGSGAGSTARQGVTCHRFQYGLNTL